ncbi:MAG: hypothetical protein CSA70_01545 [Rhodobacterales bacterium]|nr:MAG: hypothetical protein CSA70_01545 [Rhodobacterales bacterium]
MLTQKEREARGDMIRTLKQVQGDLTTEWLDRSLPEGWNGLDSTAPVTPRKTRVTIRLDEDMVKWFRKLGPHYGARINAILRIYWTALISGQVKSHWDEDEIAPPFEEYILHLAQQRQD